MLLQGTEHWSGVETCELSPPPNIHQCVLFLALGPRGPLAQARAQLRCPPSLSRFLFSFLPACLTSLPTSLLPSFPPSLLPTEEGVGATLNCLRCLVHVLRVLSSDK